MIRRFAVIAGLACLGAALASESIACGDKFLRAGRSVRGRRYAAIHPSAILVYRPAGSTDKGIRAFEKLLRRAGHAPTILPREADFTRALSAAKYDLLIADYADARAICKAAGSVPAGSTVLPLVLSKAAEVAARRDFPSLIKPYAMTEHQALAEIDSVLAGGRKNVLCGAT